MRTSSRRLRWVAAVLFAAVAGWLVRRLRRVRGMQPRIVHAMSTIPYVKYMVRADRHAGFASHSVAWHKNKPGYALVRDQDFDVVMGGDGVAPEDVHWLCLIHVLRHADIWVSFFDGVFFANSDDVANRWAFRLVKAVGIRLVVHPHGMDIIYRSRHRTRFDWVGLLQQDYPAWDMENDANSSRARIRLFCRYADLVLPGGWYMAPLLPRNDLMFHTAAFDCDELAPAPAAAPRSRPLIIHSPNHRNVKGTAHLQRAVDRLKSLGVECELRLVERLARHEALELYRQADIIADQFCIGTIGAFGFEGLALGKPVMAYVDHAHLGDPVFNHPIVNTNPDNLVRVLGVLLLVPALRERLGQASRASVEAYQSVPALAEVWARIHRHVWWGDPLRVEETRHFSTQRKARAFTEDPARPEFWHVPVDDLMPAVRAALSRIETTLEPLPA